MKKRESKWAVFTIIALSMFLFCNLSVSAKTSLSESGEYGFYDYVIDQYDIQMTVKEDNVLHITETIQAYFNTPKHGIFRTIPLENTVTRKDGSTFSGRVQISNLTVNHEYTKTIENFNCKIKIGSNDSAVTGKQTYVLSYDYNLGEDSSKEYDELYFNLIGNGWDTVIGNVTFSILMPKKFDASKVGFASGIYGSIDNGGVKYTVRGNTIKGSLKHILNPKESLTVRCELPEGYFVNAGLKTNPLEYLVIPFVIFFTQIAAWLWYRYGRDDPVVETVEFYPPEGINSLDAGFIYKGKANNLDVISLLIYLADKGYIKIEQSDKASLFSKSKDFKIIKVKNYHGTDVNESMFISGLFKKWQIVGADLYENNENLLKGNVFEVTLKDLKNSFYTTLKDILEHVNGKENKARIFEQAAVWKQIIILAMIVITYCLITIPPMIHYISWKIILLILVITGLNFTRVFSAVVGADWMIPEYVKSRNSIYMSRVIQIVRGLIIGGIAWVFILPLLLDQPVCLSAYCVGIFCAAVMTFFLKYTEKRTPYGNRMLGKLRGFKHYLEAVEKDKLEAMVEEDPEYFYHILPYAYVLGVSDKWIKKFESISMQPPTWCNDMYGFQVLTFGHFMDMAMDFASTVMASSPDGSTSSGGVFTGGGFSGGGSGGGGGGSW